MGSRGLLFLVMVAVGVGAFLFFSFLYALPLSRVTTYLVSRNLES